MIIKYSKFFESKDKFPNIKEIKIDDFTVLIGRDANSNDYLTTIVANPNDIWMHAKGVPGSHVVIKVFDKLPEKNIIMQAAQIAAKNSKSKGVSVIVYCKAKFVTKRKDMKPGQVSVDYKNAEEITINI